MTINTLGNSAHFVYRWDDTVNGSQQRATALQATCEGDLGTLESLFQEFNGFDNNPVTVIAGNPGPGLAVNHGYHSDGTTAITVTAWSGVNPAATADAGARLEFVAEMAEVMMDLRNQRRQATSWNRVAATAKGSPSSSPRCSTGRPTTTFSSDMARAGSPGGSTGQAARTG